MPAVPLLPDRLPAAARLSRWRALDGWEHRRFDWAAEPVRGSVLLQGGRADVIEKYLDLAAHLHDRGWTVTSFDWRGQGGSGRLGIGDAGHVAGFAAFEDDLAAFWDAWAQEAPGPHVVVAHSMGAHLVLRALAAGRIAPAAVVLSAPMVQVRSPLGQRGGFAFARWMCRTGAPRRAAWAMPDHPAAVEQRLRRLTVDTARGQDGRWWEADGALRLGAPSWGWVAQAFLSGAALLRDGRLATVVTPILFLVPEHDQLVDPRAALKIAARMPTAEVVRFGPESGHEVLREGAAVRDRAFAAIDRLLERVGERGNA
ncbi:alpha/beta fold hydrolase [Sphingomonas sp.]|uniref:alpha/beta fold hydrolase n=1 Tax=Sphingomonas sp. TaxID=28214 RepID=UPI003CC5B5F7